MRISDWSSDVCSADLLHRADESGVRRLAQRGLVGGGDLCGRLGGGGNGKRKDANRQDDGADHGSFLSGVCGGSGSIGISAGGSGPTNSSRLGQRSSGFRTSVSSSRQEPKRPLSAQSVPLPLDPGGPRILHNHPPPPNSPPPHHPPPP